MIRMEQRWEVIYGHFADFVDTLEAVNAVQRTRGWTEFTPMAPMAGRANEVVLVSDYEDYTAYKREEDAAYADPEFMKAWRQGAQFVVQGSGHIEILEPVPHLA